MRKVFAYSVLLVLGLVMSQWLPNVVGEAYTDVKDIVRLLTMVGLSFLMIRVGYEFDIDKSRIKRYIWDYFVAFTAAGLPWIFVSLYFTFVMLPRDVWYTLDAWKETLLVGRFAASTSAGVLFAMLIAGGLGGTWLFRKLRILAIFDDLDTILFMIPLKMMMVGLAWQLGAIVVIMVSILVIGYVFLHRIRIPISWPWVMVYSVGITAFSELIYRYSKMIDETIPIHIEVLLPAFVLGSVIAYPEQQASAEGQAHHGHPEIETPTERRVATIVGGVFMLLVGLSMPVISGGAYQAGSVIQGIGHVTASQPPIGWGAIVLHVLMITILSNIGKMFPALCYRTEAHWRERLAVAISMWPRGEVGAGILALALSYGVGGPIVTVAMLSLALNLLMTGLYIYVVKHLVGLLPGYAQGPHAWKGSLTVVSSEQR